MWSPIFGISRDSRAAMQSIYALATTLIVQIVTARTVQTSWTVPNGSLSDFAQTFTGGDALPIAWDGWSSGSINEYLDNATVADLWVTSYNFAQYQYSQYLTVGNVNISHAGSYNWTINVNSSSLANTAEYVLRFMPPQSTYNSSSVQISSTGFIILPNDETTTATTTITSASASTTSTTTSTPSTSTAAAASSSPSSGLSTGAKAGIGIGVSIGAIGILTALGFLLRRRNVPLTQNPTPPSPNKTIEGPAELDVVSEERSKQIYSPVPVHELPTQPAELDSGDYL